MDIDGKIKRRLKKDGLTIEDLTPEQVEKVREEMTELASLGRGAMILDGFFSSMEYIGLVLKKGYERNNK